MKNPAISGQTLFWTIAGIIIISGIFFRFWNLGSDELTFDEGIYAFRSIGYLDYMENPAQVTPVQLFADRETPAWLSLSFHDAPPLFFALEHFFFWAFGESLLVSRLPSAFAGLGIVALMFFVARSIFEKFKDETLRCKKDWAGLLAAAVTAVSFASVAVSRLNQLEAVLFFFILLNIFLFLKFIDGRKWWWLFGASFGLCLLVKYTAVFLIPTYYVYLFIIRSPLLKDWRWHVGWGIIASAFFLPVIIYNINLYNLLGHFDLQFAYLFHQVTPEWRGVGGKQQEPFGNILTNVAIIYSIPFMVIAGAGLILCASKKFLGKIRWLPILLFIFILALLAAVGSAVRFTSYLIIPATLFITFAFFCFFKKFNNLSPFLVIAFVASFLLYESYFTTSIAFLSPADYGIVKLDKYFDSAFGNARPAGLLRHPNPNLNRVIKEYAENRPATLPLTGLVYDDQISTPARLWLFSRRQYYHGIPVMSASAFFEELKNSGGQTLKGFEIYFVKADPATAISEIKNPEYLESLDSFFSKLPAASKFTIKTSQSAPAFEVSRFEI